MPHLIFKLIQNGISLVLHSKLFLSHIYNMLRKKKFLPYILIFQYLVNPINTSRSII